MLRVSAAVVVEGNAKIGKVLLVSQAHLGNNAKLGDALFFCADRNRSPMRVVGANVDAALSAQPLIPGPNVGLNVFDEVTDMNRPVSVGQGARY